MRVPYTAGSAVGGRGPYDRTADRLKRATVRPPKQRHGATAFGAMDLRVAPDNRTGTTLFNS